jgi:hypothetical protein
MTTFSVLLMLLLIVLATSCITIIVIIVTAPLQAPMVEKVIALPGMPEFADEKLWVEKITYSLPVPPDHRAAIIAVLACVIAGVIIMLILLSVTYIHWYDPTKQQQDSFKRTCVESEEWALTIPEEAWSPTHSDHGKGD